MARGFLRWAGRGMLVASSGAALVLACGDDSGQEPVTYPQRGRNSSASSTSSSGGTSSGSSGSSGDGDAGAARSLCAVVKDIVAAADKCCTSATDTDTPEYRSLELTEAFIDAACTVLDASITAGRTKVASKPECITAVEEYLKTAQCPVVRTNHAFAGMADATACVGAYEGTVAAGGGCKGDHECVAGLTCVGYTSGEDGKCLTPPALGEPCGAAPQDGGSTLRVTIGLGDHPGCAPGAYCSGGSCVARKVAGEDCFDHEQCNGTKCYQGKCGGAVARAASGGPCKFSSDCDNTLGCHYAPGAQTGTCAAAKPAGQPCSSRSAGECEGRCVRADGGTDGTCAAWCGSK